MTLLTIRNLKTHYKTGTGYLRAVDGVSLDLEKKESLGIAGESGCGKSTVALTLMRLVSKNAVISGSAVLNDTDLMAIPDHRYNEVRLEKIALISQAAMGGLNPVYTIGSQIAEALVVRKKMNKQTAMEKAGQLLAKVEIDPRRANSFPHELSGGMRQRVMIAMSLVLNPEIVIADEPTTALDVINQATIIKLLHKLKMEMGLSVIFISHDLSILSQSCERIVIMYAGKVVEQGRVNDIFNHPRHPYTIALIHSFPDISGKAGPLVSLPGQVPDLTSDVSGCAFLGRCDRATKRCAKLEPEPVTLSDHHEVTCFLHD